MKRMLTLRLTLRCADEGLPAFAGDIRRTVTRWRSSMPDETNDRFSGWHKDEDGNILVFPCAGYSTALFAETGVVLCIEFWRSPESIGTTPERLQSVLMPAQARALAKSLLRMADAAEVGPTDSDLKN